MSKKIPYHATVLFYHGLIQKKYDKLFGCLCDLNVVNKIGLLRERAWSPTRDETEVISLV